MFIFAHSSEKYHQKVCVLALFGNFHVLFSLHFGMFSLQNAPFRLSSLLGSLSFLNPDNVVLVAKYHYFSIFMHFKHDLFFIIYSLLCSCLEHSSVHLVLRFGAFYLAFCCIQPRVLLQIALRFAADSIAFWCIQRCVLYEIAQKVV